MHLKTIIFTAGIALGIVVGFKSPLASEIGITAVLLAIAQGVLLFIGRNKINVEHDSRKPGGLSAALITTLVSVGLFFGIVRIQFVEENVPFVCERTCAIQAVLVASPEKKDSYQSFVVRRSEVEAGELSILVRAPLYPEYNVGDELLLSGKVTEPEFIYPHEGNEGFDYASYLHTRDVGSIMMFPKITVLDTEVHTIPHMLGRWKEDMTARLHAHVSSPQSALSSGMLFGDSSMPKNITSSFRVAGLSHIVVLSGFNIAIVIAFVLFVFALLPLALRIVLASVFVILFVLMVGAEASIVRASLMAFIALLSQLVGRQYIARQALIISFLMIIMYEPYSLLADVSLHLSFLATAGIVYLSDPIKMYVQKLTSNAFLIGLCTTTIAAYIGTLPYLMHVFGAVSLYGLVANIAALPVVPIAMLLSFLVVVASYISVTLALLFGYVEGLLSGAIMFIAHAVERLPFSSVSVSISFFTMSLAYVIVALVAFYLSHKQENETFQTTKEGFLTDVIKY